MALTLNILKQWYLEIQTQLIAQKSEKWRGIEFENWQRLKNLSGDQRVPKLYLETNEIPLGQTDHEIRVFMCTCIFPPKYRSIKTIFMDR